MVISSLVLLHGKGMTTYTPFGYPANLPQNKYRVSSSIMLRNVERETWGKARLGGLVIPDNQALRLRWGIWGTRYHSPLRYLAPSSLRRIGPSRCTLNTVKREMKEIKEHQ